jgi:hypothetical protein
MKVEKEQEKLESKIEAADKADEQRSASMIKAGKPVVAPWQGEAARRAAEHSKRNIEQIIKGNASLRRELLALELMNKIAEDNVLIERIKLIVPLLAAKLERAEEFRMELLKLTAEIEVLARDDAPISQRRSGRSWQMRGGAQSGVGHGQGRGAFLCRANRDSEFEIAKAAKAPLEQKLAALLIDATIEL